MKLPALTPRSLRARLTVWLGLVLGLVLIGFTVAQYALLAGSLTSELDRSLADRAQQVNNALRPFPPPGPRGRPPGGPPGNGPGGLPRGRIVVPPPDNFASADTFVQIVSLDGEVLGASDNLSGVTLPVSDGALAAARTGAGRFALAELQDERVRVYSAPLTAQGQTVGMIQVARSLDLVDRSLEQLRLVAGLGLIVALALVTLVVRVVAGAALRPVERVIATAEAIGASGDLGRRVTGPVSSDEVGRLATTFNAMLDRIEASSRALQGAYARVEGALEAQRRFAADASHELRTPLTTIRNNASLLTQYANVTPEDQTAALTQISHEAERMSRLVNDLLALARADAGQGLPRVLVELGPLVEDVAAQARLLSRGQHMITTEIAGNCTVSGSSDALRQLALLLLDNALKFTPAGGRITMRLEPQDADAYLYVADTGMGIAAADLPHIFERFYQADRSRHAGGTGLGLSIARWIVEEHGGAIQAASTPGQGTTFTVCLPRAEV